MSSWKNFKIKKKLLRNDFILRAEIRSHYFSRDSNFAKCRKHLSLGHVIKFFFGGIAHTYLNC